MQTLILKILELEAESSNKITEAENEAATKIELAKAQAAAMINDAKSAYKGILGAELQRAKLEAERERAMMHAQLEFSLDGLRHKAKENAEKAAQFVLSAVSEVAL